MSGNASGECEVSVNLGIIMLAGISCLPYYFKYEKKKPQTRETVVLAVMTALTVASRVIFLPLPGFKPVSAMVIICGMAFGRESGFLCGSLSAFLSNFMFGQGPWTPFQMIAWGTTGWMAGILNRKDGFWKHKIGVAVYGFFTGVFFSMVMDIWTVLAAEESFRWIRYVAVMTASLPVTVEYGISNVVFLWMLTPVFMKKLNRVKYKYGFYETEPFNTENKRREK